MATECRVRFANEMLPLTIELTASGESIQLVQKGFGVPEVRRVKPLREPAVDGGKKFARVRPLAPFAPPPGEVGRGAQLPQLRALLAGNGQGTAEAGFHLERLRLGKGQQQLAPEPMQLSLDPARSRSHDVVEGIGREAKAGLSLACSSLRLGEQAQEVGRPHLGLRFPIVRLSPTDLRYAV